MFSLRERERERGVKRVGAKQINMAKPLLIAPVLEAFEKEENEDRRKGKAGKGKDQGKNDKNGK